MKEAKLINCPFCDGEAEIDCDDHFSNWFVRCTKCFCKTPKYTTEFFAKARWNTRKPMERILERLKEEPYINKGGELFLNGYNEDCLPLRKVFEIVKEEGGIE